MKAKSYLPFSVATEKSVMVTRCEMVDQVYSTKNDESSSDPKCARVATEDDTLFGLRCNIDAILYRDDDSIIDIIRASSLDNRA